jgi:hypothetical protein
VADEVNIRVVVPRVRRALGSFGAALTDDQLRDVVADAIADVILYTRGAFGQQLVVLHTDTATGTPDEYGTTTALTFPEQSVIAAQAALSWFIRQIGTLKTSETISDEAQSWSYQLSSGAITAQIKQLIADRDAALDAIANTGIGLDSYVSFIAVRDRHVSRLIEPWVHDSHGGQELSRW